MSNVTTIINSMRADINETYLSLIDSVIGHLDLFVKWPSTAELLLPGVDRTVKYHIYPDAMCVKLKEKNIPKNTLSNGPAIVSYLYAGGERPFRKKKNIQWTIHHIYDGQFPWPERSDTLRSVKDGNHFSQSAGLVAIHPIADALADEFAYFAWTLRYEAFIRFEYDPDGVFGYHQK